MYMTANEFRKMALAFAGAQESSHMNHPDFRVGGKIFATLGYPQDDVGMVKLKPEQQKSLIQAEPEAFFPAKGAWGLRGATHVRLAHARKRTLRKALATAWANVKAKSG